MSKTSEATRAARHLARLSNLNITDKQRAARAENARKATAVRMAKRAALAAFKKK